MFAVGVDEHLLVSSWLGSSVLDSVGVEEVFADFVSVVAQWNLLGALQLQEPGCLVVLPFAEVAGAVPVVDGVGVNDFKFC